MKNLARTVVLSRCPDYQRGNLEKSVRDILDHLGGIDQYISKDDRVLIKPNLLKGSLPGECITTHPAIVETVVKIIIDHGGRPFIGDSPAFGDLAGVAKVTGMADICNRYNIKLQPFNTPVAVRVSDPFVKTLHIDKAVLDADKIINIPKLKTHVQVGFSGAVKNLFGCLSGKKKVLWHFKAGDREHRFGRMLLEIYNTVSPALHIVDAVIALEGEGPTKGDPKQVGLIAASEDALSLDRLLCEVVGLPVSSSEILGALKSHYGISINVGEITIKGDPLNNFTGNPFLLPEKIPIRFSLTRITGSVLKHLKIKASAKMNKSYGVDDTFK
ncbi:MAG: DUF362 domain-containing protein [Nitrospirae bacterium]|nr:DUF362 domain-containing protein [Nitrospirota bacterium]